MEAARRVVGLFAAAAVAAVVGIASDIVVAWAALGIAATGVALLAVVLVGLIEVLNLHAVVAVTAASEQQ